MVYTLEAISLISLNLPLGVYNRNVKGSKMNKELDRESKNVYHIKKEKYTDHGMLGIDHKQYTALLK